MFFITPSKKEYPEIIWTKIQCVYQPYFFVKIFTNVKFLREYFVTYSIFWGENFVKFQKKLKKIATFLLGFERGRGGGKEVVETCHHLMLNPPWGCLLAYDITLKFEKKKKKTSVQACKWNT
jgi:hypothetical protein